MEILNGIIENVQIGYEDHGIMTAWLQITHEEGSQAFGGYMLRDHRSLGLFITRVIETIGVQGWEKLEGQPLRVGIEDGLIRKIGHLYKDQWFEPRKELAACPPNPPSGS